jgi:hypothetical protein
MEEEVVNDFRTAIISGEYARARELSTRMNVSPEALRKIEYQMYE